MPTTEITLEQVNQNMLDGKPFTVRLEYPIYKEHIDWASFSDYVVKALTHYHPELAETLMKWHRKKFIYNGTEFSNLLKRQWEYSGHTEYTFIFRSVAGHLRDLLSNSPEKMRITKAFRKTIHKLSMKEISERYSYDNRFLQQLTEGWKEVTSSQKVCEGFVFEFALFDNEKGPAYYNNEDSCIWGSHGSPYVEAQYLLLNNRAYAIRAWKLRHADQTPSTYYCDARWWAFPTDNGFAINNHYGYGVDIQHLVDFLDAKFSYDTINGTYGPIENSGTYIFPKKQKATRITLDSSYDHNFIPYLEGPCCDECGCVMHADEAYWIESEDREICQSCVDDAYTWCEYTREFHRDEDMVDIVENKNGYQDSIFEKAMASNDIYYCAYCDDAYHSDYLYYAEGNEDDVFCETCYNAVTTECDCCGGKTYINTLKDVNDVLICPECFEDLFFKCDECNSYTNSDYVRYIDHQELCPFCAEERKNE